MHNLLFLNEEYKLRRDKRTGITYKTTGGGFD